MEGRVTTLATNEGGKQSEKPTTSKNMLEEAQSNTEVVPRDEEECMEDMDNQQLNQVNSSRNKSSSQY